MDSETFTELLSVAAEGARTLLIAEACLQKLPAGVTDEQRLALEQVEARILVAQTLFKEIAAAAHYSLPGGFEMKSDDETVLNQIVEDDEKYMNASLITSDIG